MLTAVLRSRLCISLIEPGQNGWGAGINAEVQVELEPLSEADVGLALKALAHACEQFDHKSLNASVGDLLESVRDEVQEDCPTANVRAVSIVRQDGYTCSI